MTFGCFLDDVLCTNDWNWCDRRFLRRFRKANTRTAFKSGKALAACVTQSNGTILKDAIKAEWSRITPGEKYEGRLDTFGTDLVQTKIIKMYIQNYTFEYDLGSRWYVSEFHSTKEKYK